MAQGEGFVHPLVGAAQVLDNGAHTSRLCLAFEDGRE